MLQPKRVKYRKSHKGHRRGRAHAGAAILFGDFGLQAVEPAWITSRQIEAARRAMVRYIRRGGKVWIRIFPDHPVTAKPAETRQGGGKRFSRPLGSRCQAGENIIRTGWCSRGFSQGSDAPRGI